MLNLLAKSADVAAVEIKDTLGGGGYKPLASGVYRAVITNLYLSQETPTDSVNCKVEYAVQVEGETTPYTLRISECIWSSKTQGHYYVDPRSGEKKELMGRTRIDQLFLLLTGKDLNDAAQAGLFEEKYHKVRRNGEEVPTKFPTCVALKDTPVHIAVLHEVSNKQERSETGKWTNTNEKRESNEVVSVFNQQGYSLAEMMAMQAGGEAPEEKFMSIWAEVNTGKVRDRFKPVSGGAVAGLPNAGGDAPKRLVLGQ